MAAIVDPANANQAILDDGKLGFAIYMVPTDAFDVTAPSVAQLNAAMKPENILGYGNISEAVKWDVN